MFRPYLLTLLLFAQPVLAAEPPVLSTQVSAVTVFADRAQVTRSAAIDLPKEAARVVIAKLPGWIDADSVRVALDPPGAGRILDVAVSTAYLAEASEAAVRKALQGVQETTDDVAAIADEERTLNEEIARLDGLRTFAVDRVPREMTGGEVKLKTFTDTLAYVSEAVRKDRMVLRQLAKKRRDLEPVLSARQRELAEVQTRAQLQQSAVTVELSGSGRAQLKVTYLTPGAAWESVGELRVAKGAASVAVQQFASVVQTTGEDWTGATLTFSTQRPDDVLGVPEAHGLMLDKNGAGLGDVIGHHGESFTRAQSLYTEQNAAVARNARHWGDSLARQTDVQNRAVESFAQLSRRGTTGHFTALADRTVRSDGKPVRVPISNGEFAATTKIVAVPEVSLNAVRVADLHNEGKAPILPGRAALFTEGAFVGASQLAFTAPGEAFSVFLGVDDRLKMERTLDKKTSVLRRSGKRTEMALAFVLTAENLGNEPIVVEMAERIPVAQTNEIEIDDVELPRKAKPDAHGVAHWTETIAPHAKVTWRVSYTLEYPSDYVARAKARRDDEAPSPAAPAAMPKMYERIDALEKAL
jgi:uncharacterized protein (TIGR02231 family)